MQNKLKRCHVLFSALVALMLMSQVAHAEIYGLLHGRSADVSRLPNTSIDTGVVFGDNYQLLGVRGNFKLTPIFLVYANIAFAESGITDGVPFGVGAMYTIENLFANFDTGVKISYHRGSFEANSGPDFTRTNVALETLISTQRGYGPSGNIDLYGNLGFQSFGGDGGGDLELSIGGGAIFPFGPGEVFVGIDFVEDAVFGGGFRLFF